VQKCNTGMVNAGDIAANIQAKASALPPRSNYSAKLNAEAMQVIDETFTELMGVFSAWKQAFPNDEVLGAGKRQFTKALIDNEVTTKAQLDNGLYFARKAGTAFWPDLETFVGWCNTPAALEGIPTANEAYEEFCRKCHDLPNAGFTHVIVRLAGKGAGTWEMRNLPREKSFPLFKRSYDVLVRRVMNGEQVGETIPPALPEVIEIQCTKEKNLTEMQKLRGGLKL
jgi:hypothetical protein